MAYRKLIALPLALTIALYFAAGPAMAQSPPNVTVELRAIDPAGASIVPPNTQVYGRIGYTTDAPVRLVLLPYRDGQPIENFTNGGSPQYAPGSGETIAWFSFHEPQSIDEVRAVANDAWGTVFAEDGIRQTIVWRAGAAAPQTAGWVAPLRAAPKDIVVEPQAEMNPAAEWILLWAIQLFFLVVPLSVVLQIVAWRKLEGRWKDLARISGYLMAALWLFVIVTSLAGSNLSPIWLVFLSPFFAVFLTILLVAHSRSQKASVAS